MNCKNKSTNCGCSDRAYTTPPPCNTAGECEGELCSELFCEECVTHCRTSSSYLGFSINKNDRLDYILQKLVVKVLNSTSGVNTIYGLKVLNEYATSIQIAFEPIVDIHYRIHLETTVSRPTSVLAIDPLPNTKKYTIDN